MNSKIEELLNYLLDQRSDLISSIKSSDIHGIATEGKIVALEKTDALIVKVIDSIDQVNISGK